MEIWLVENVVFLASEFSYSSNNKHLFWGPTINYLLNEKFAIGVGCDVTKAVFTFNSVSGRVEKDFKLVIRYRFEEAQPRGGLPGLFFYLTLK